MPALSRFAVRPRALGVLVLALVVGGVGLVAVQAADPSDGPAAAGAVPLQPDADELVFVQAEDEAFYLRNVTFVAFGGSFVLTGRAVPENSITQEHYGPVTVRVPWERVRSLRGFDSEELRAKVSTKAGGTADATSAAGGQTRPSAFYSQDDVQYFPPGPEAADDASAATD